MNATRPELHWLEDPQVFAVNRLDAHSDHIWYAGGSDLRQSLDGAWRFAYSPRPADRPADFWQEGASLDSFDEIAVPGHIETQGYGQIQYINTMYPWDGRHYLRPPQIAWDDTPVGSYVCTFTLDEALREEKALKALCDADPQVRELLDMAKRVEGMPRHASTHAAGAVLTAEPAAHSAPLAASAESIVTPFAPTTPPSR